MENNQLNENVEVNENSLDSVANEANEASEKAEVAEIEKAEVAQVKTKTVFRKGKLRSVIAACLATMIFGAGVGFASSQILIRLTDVSYGGGVLSPRFEDEEKPARSREKDNVDRNAIPGILKSTEGSTRGSYNQEYSSVELFEKMSDTVVGIKVGSDAEMSDIVGSGVVISDDGFIITCAHVIVGANGEVSEKVVVVVDDYDDPSIQHEYEAMVFGKDSPTDLALLQIKRDEPFKYAEIGNSSELKRGQSVVAIGNPLGLVKTITQGIISGLQRDLGEGENAYMLPSIQTDAALNPGNSGCPLFDMYGNVVGIVNIKLVLNTQLDNLGFAISIDEAMPIIEDLAENGAVTTRAMLGITAQAITPQTRYVGDIEKGLVVETVAAGSPAEKSGLSRGDIIIEIDGVEVGNVADVQAIVKEKSIGDEVDVLIIRYNNYGEPEEMTLTFGLTSAA